MKKTETNEKKFLTAIQAAEYLGMSRLSVYRLVDAKKITAYKVGTKKLLFESKDLDQYVHQFPIGKRP